MSDWTVVDLSPSAVAPEPVVVTLTPREDLQQVLRDWSVRHDLPFEDRIIDTDIDDDLRIVLVGLTETADGDIVVKRRSYTVTARFVVEVAYAVEASSEDAAREAAEDEFVGYSLEVSYGDAEVVDTDYYGITDVSED